MLEIFHILELSSQLASVEILDRLHYYDAVGGGSLLLRIEDQLLCSLGRRIRPLKFLFAASLSRGRAFQSAYH